MFRKLILASAVSLALLPGASWSLGLGGIRTQSALNEPFSGEIDLHDVKPDELDTVKAALASPAEFSKVGSDRPHFLTSLRFSPQVSASGRAVVRIDSREPIREPFLDFVVEVTWPNGRIVKGFTVLLDPPVTLDRSAPRVSPPRAASRGAPSRAAAAATPPAAARNAAGYPLRYGPVGSGTGLWQVARAMAPPGASVQQTAMALYRSNQDAFIRGNINKLKLGAELEIPTPDELFAMDTGAARREFSNAVRGRRVATAPITDISRAQRPADRLEIAAAPAPGAGQAAQAPPPAPGTGAEPGMGAMERDLLLVQEAAESTRQEAEDLRTRVRELETQLADIKTLLELRNQQLAQLESGSPADTQGPGAAGMTDVSPDLATAEPEPMPTVDVMPGVSGAEPATGLEPGPGPELVAAPELGIEPMTGIEPGPDVVAVPELGVEPTTGMEPGPDAVTGLEPGVEPTTGIEPGPDAVTGLEPGVEPTTGIEPGPDAVTGLEPGVEPTTGIEPGPDAVTALEPGVEPTAGVEPGFEPSTMLEPDATATGLDTTSDQVAQSEPSPAERPFWEDLDLSPSTLGAVVGTPAVLGLFGIWMMRRRKSKSEDLVLEDVADDDGVPSDFGPSSGGESFSEQPLSIPGLDGDSVDGTSLQSAQSSFFGNIDGDTEEADILSEVNVYVAFGRYREAEKLLKEEIEASPERMDLKFKLGEIHHATQDVGALRDLQAELRQAGAEDLYPDDWRQLQSLAGELGSVPAEKSSVVAFPSPGATESTRTVQRPLSREPERRDEIGELQLSSLADDELLSSEEPPMTADVPGAAVSSSGSVTASGALDTDDQGGMGSVLALSETTGGTTNESSVFDSRFDGFDDLDFQSEQAPDSGAPPELAVSSTPAGSTGPAPGASVDSLGEGSTSTRDSAAEEIFSSQWEMDSGLWDESATKIDLARAYMEMEDPDAARVILEEVIAEGSDEQKSEAQEMLSRIK